MAEEQKLTLDDLLLNFDVNDERVKAVNDAFALKPDAITNAFNATQKAQKSNDEALNYLNNKSQSIIKAQNQNQNNNNPNKVPSFDSLDDLFEDIENRPDFQQYLRKGDKTKPQKMVEMFKNYDSIDTLIDRKSTYNKLKSLIDLNFEMVPEKCTNRQVSQVGINGSRGLGKSTMLYATGVRYQEEYIEEHKHDDEKCEFYVFNITFNSVTSFKPDEKKKNINDTLVMYEKYPIATRLLFHHFFEIDIQKSDIIFDEFRKYLNDARLNFLGISENDREMGDVKFSNLFLESLGKKTKVLITIDEILGCSIGSKFYPASNDMEYKKLTILHIINKIQDHNISNLCVVISTLDSTITESNKSVSGRDRGYAKLPGLNRNSAKERFEMELESVDFSADQKIMYRHFFELAFANPRSFIALLETIDENYKKWHGSDLSLQISQYIGKRCVYVYHAKDPKIDISKLITDALTNKIHEITTDVSLPQSLGLYNMSFTNDTGPFIPVLNICYLYGWLAYKEQQQNENNIASDSVELLIYKLLRTLNPSNSFDWLMFERFHRLWETFKFLVESMDNHTFMVHLTKHYSISQSVFNALKEKGWTNIFNFKSFPSYEPGELYVIEVDDSFNSLLENEIIKQHILDRNHFMISFNSTKIKNKGFDHVLVVWDGDKYRMIFIDNKHSVIQTFGSDDNEPNDFKKPHKSAFQLTDIFIKAKQNKPPQWMCNALNTSGLHQDIFFIIVARGQIPAKYKPSKTKYKFIILDDMTSLYSPSFSYSHLLKERIDQNKNNDNDINMLSNDYNSDEDETKENKMEIDQNEESEEDEDNDIIIMTNKKKKNNINMVQKNKNKKRKFNKNDAIPSETGQQPFNKKRKLNP